MSNASFSQANMNDTLQTARKKTVGCHCVNAKDCAPCRVTCEAAKGPSYRIGFVMAASRGWLTQVSIEMHQFINNTLYWFSNDVFALFKWNTNRLFMK